MPTIGEILRRKARQSIVSCGAADSVLDAVRRMDEANTGSVVVLQGDQLAGIFTERDLMRRVVLRGREAATTEVSEVMTRELVYARPEEDAHAAMARMTRHRCRHLPVIDGDRAIGVVSIGDLIKEQVVEQTDEILVLKQFISSS